MDEIDPFVELVLYFILLHNYYSSNKIASSIFSGNALPSVSGRVKNATIPPTNAEPPITIRGNGAQMVDKLATCKVVTFV